MLSGIACGNVESSKWSILWNTASIISISVVILKICALLRVKYFSWSGIFFLYFSCGTYFPKIVCYRLEQLIFTYWQTKLFTILFEHLLIYSVRPWTLTQILNHQNCFLNFVPYLIIILSPCLDIRMRSKI